SADSFDLVILGAGSGGYACALRAAQLGLRVALVEKDKLGGTCLHVGCIPTKALLHAAEVADAARESAHVGIRASFDGVDVPALHTYKDGVVNRLHKGLTGLIRGRGITVLEGEGRLIGPRTVQVGDRRVTGERVLTADHALRLDRIPTRAVVVGGGVIGCEFASVWRSFGVEVTIVEALPRLLPGEDEASSAALARAFRKRGITARTGVGV